MKCEKRTRRRRHPELTTRRNTTAKGPNCWTEKIRVHNSLYERRANGGDGCFDLSVGDKRKGKNSFADPAHAFKAYRGRRIIALLILNLDARWRSVFNSSSGCFTPGKEPRHPLNSRSYGPKICFTFRMCIGICYIYMPISMEDGHHK